MAAAGIYGIAFSPYVGPWVNDVPVVFNTYTSEQVTQLLSPVAKKFSLIATYGQGTFVWQNVPNIQDSNRYNIQAAKNVGLKVSADRRIKPETKVPLAINVALITESAEQTTLVATNLGGDSDSVASIGSAIAGSLSPDTVNENWFRVVQSVNGEDLIDIAQTLARLRF